MTCEECGEPTTARYCSDKCGRKASGITSRRLCAWCKQPLERKQYAHGAETWTKFAKRTHCDSNCAAKARAGNALRTGRVEAGTIEKRILTALRDYDGLPLTYDDLAEEVGTSKANVQTLTTGLVRRGLVERYRFEGQTLLRALEWEKAA